MIEESKRAEYAKLAEQSFENKAFSKALMESLPYAAMLIHKDRVILAANSAAKKIGVVEMTNCWDTFGKRASIPEKDLEYIEMHGKAPEDGTKCVFCLADEALAKQERIVENIDAGGKIWETYWIPVDPEIYLHYAIDMTDKQAVM